MAQPQKLAYRSAPSQEHPHVEWFELHADGILHECLVMNRDGNGNVMFIPLNHLDDIDRRRVAGILADRNVRNFPLWDLMAQRTLGNGINALAYFHQLVKILTPNGKTLEPKSGQMGAGGTVSLNPVQ